MSWLALIFLAHGFEGAQYESGLRYGEKLFETEQQCWEKFESYGWNEVRRYGNFYFSVATTRVYDAKSLGVAIVSCVPFEDE